MKENENVLTDSKPNSLLSRGFNWTKWFMQTNFFQMGLNTPFAYLAITTAIATGGWLPILIAITTTTILATSIVKTIIDGYLVSKTNNNVGYISSGDKEDDQNKEVNEVKVNNFIVNTDRVNNYLSGSMNLMYVGLAVGVPVIGLGMYMLGITVPALACVIYGPSIIGSLILGSKVIFGAVTAIAAYETLKSADNRISSTINQTSNTITESKRISIVNPEKNDCWGRFIKETLFNGILNERRK